MKTKYYLLIFLVFVFVALSVRQYININRQQRDETAEFINKQIILCGKSSNVFFSELPYTCHR